MTETTRVLVHVNSDDVPVGVYASAEAFRAHVMVETRIMLDADDNRPGAPPPDTWRVQTRHEDDYSVPDLDARIVTIFIAIPPHLDVTYRHAKARWFPLRGTGDEDGADWQRARSTTPMLTLTRNGQRVIITRRPRLPVADGDEARYLPVDRLELRAHTATPEGECWRLMGREGTPWFEEILAEVQIGPRDGVRARAVVPFQADMTRTAVHLTLIGLLPRESEVV